MQHKKCKLNKNKKRNIRQYSWGSLRVSTCGLTFSADDAF